MRRTAAGWAWVSCSLGLTFASSAGLGAEALISESPKVALTIYNADLALVEESRNLDLPNGRTRVEFRDVSARIRPETVTLLAADTLIVEQNFDFDLLTPEKLMEKAVGRQVQIVRMNPGNGAELTETANVLSVNNGVVLKIEDRIEVLRADGVPTRVIFDKVPENLRARPTLSVTLQSDRPGPREAKLSYLSNGLSWTADYVALFDDKLGKLDLQGWITLTNRSGTTFNDAQTQLIAGNINLRRAEQHEWDRQRQNPVRSAGQAEGKRPLADYYVYPLQERTTIADNQTKQVGFIDASGIAARKIYEYRADWFDSSSDPLHADVVIRFSNSSTGGLARELPGGVMRVYMRDAQGAPKFVGENAVPHTPAGSELSIKTGEAFDITVQPTLVSRQKAGTWRSEYQMEYLVRNARPEEVTVELRQGGLYRDGEVHKESLKSRRVDAHTLEWAIKVPARGETKLAFTVETGW
jgi:hypothetical protein